MTASFIQPHESGHPLYMRGCLFFADGRALILTASLRRIGRAKSGRPWSRFEVTVSVNASGAAVHESISLVPFIYQGPVSEIAGAIFPRLRPILGDIK